MSFREKSAWISLIAILVVTGIYFLHGYQHPGGAQGLLYCFVAFLAIEAVGHLVVAWRAPREARAPKDEREQLIDLKATRLAAYVYVVASFAAVARLHAGAGAIGIANGVMLAFVLAQLVRQAARIVYHRRGF